MQITLGLPRLIEILDARKQPSTPMMKIYPDTEHNNEKDARVLAEKIKEVKLKDLVADMDVDFGKKKVEIKVDAKALRETHSGIQKVADRLIEKKFKITVSGDTLVLNVAEMDFKEIYKMKEKIKEIVVSGVKGVPQVVVSKEGKEFLIYANGSNLKEVLEIKGINRNKITSNDIHDVFNVLGIEAARQTIMNEIKNVLQNQGLDINERHLQMVADAMTYSGVVKGVTRMGIITDKASVLARATFETPDKEFINATLKGSKDELNSVIENILINQPIPVGTGLPGLLVEITGALAKEQKSEKSEKKEVEVAEKPKKTKKKKE